MKAPIVRVYIGNDRDISQKVSRFYLDEDVEKADMVEFTIDSDHALDMIDDEDLVAGATIKYQWGYAGSVLSKLRTARITAVNPKYGKTVVIDVVALDKGVELKKVQSDKVWEAMTASDIAREIAGKYSLTPEVDDTTTIFDSMPQGHRSDFEFLKFLSQYGDEGDFIFYVTSNVLRFKKIDVGKQALVTFRRGDADWVEFNPKVDELKQKNASNSVKSVSVDPLTKKVVNVVSGDKNESLGKKNLKFDVNGVFQGIEQVLPLPSDKDVATTEAQQKAITKQAHQASSRGVLTADFVIEGNPLITVDEIITIENVGLRHQGNWRIVNVSHKIAPKSKYVTTMKLSKDGTSKAAKASGGEDNTNVNNTQGENQVDKTTRVYEWDQDGNPVGDNPFGG